MFVDFYMFVSEKIFLDIGDENYRFILKSVWWADIIGFFIQCVFTVLFIRQLNKGSCSIAGEIVVFVLLNFILVWLVNKRDAFSVRYMATMGGMPAADCISRLQEMKIWLLQFDPKVFFCMILGMSIHCKRRSEGRACLQILVCMVVGFQCANFLINVLLYIYKEPLTTFYGLLGDTFNPPSAFIYLLPDMISFSIKMAFLFLFMRQLRRGSLAIMPEILGTVMLHSLILWVPRVVRVWISRFGGHSMWAWYIVMERVRRDMNQMGGVSAGIFS